MKRATRRIVAGMLALWGTFAAMASQLAELPRVFLDTAYLAPAGATITVTANGNLQAALNRARPGDQVLLAPGATCSGNFVLRAPRDMAPPSTSVLTCPTKRSRPKASG